MIVVSDHFDVSIQLSGRTLSSCSAQVGIHQNPDDLVKTLRRLRRCVDVHYEVSVVHDIGAQELRLYTDPGLWQTECIYKQVSFVTVSMWILPTHPHPGLRFLSHLLPSFTPRLPLSFSGRCMRPLFIVDLEEQKMLIKRDHIRHLQSGSQNTGDWGWPKLVEKGLVSGAQPFGHDPCFTMFVKLAMDSRP